MTEQLPKEIKHVWVASIVLSGGIGLLLTIGVWFGYLWWHWWWWLAVVVGGLTILDIMVELAMVHIGMLFGAIRLQRMLCICIMV